MKFFLQICLSGLIFLFGGNESIFAQKALKDKLTDKQDEPKITLKGRVVSFRSVPLSNMNVIFINSTNVGATDLQQTRTDAKGNFTFNVPKSTNFKDRNKYTVFDDISDLNRKVNYDFRISEDNIIYLVVDIPPRVVSQVIVLDEQKQPLAEVAVTIDNKKYQTNIVGIAQTNASENDQSLFAVENAPILNFEYDKNLKKMTLTVQRPKEGEVVIVKAVRSTEKLEDAEARSLIQTQEVLVDKIKDTETQITEITNILETKANISPEERKRLEERLSELKNSLNNDTKILLIAQVKAKDAYEKLQKAFSLTKIEADEAKMEKERIKLLNQLEQEKYQRNIIIFITVALALSIIVAVVFFNLRRINSQRNQLAEKVEEINFKNEMLEQSSLILDNKNKQINEKNNQLLEQTQELELKNIKITDSIRYARTIQQSILPSPNLVGSVLNDFFIFFEPKDIVSGDFYWFSKQGNEAVIIVADCTGHGVPGAFMTMMGNTLLNQIVNESQITNPADILTELNRKIQSTLHQNQDINDDKKDGDGMDVVVLTLNLEERKVSFSGAKNALYYAKDGELFYLKGSNISIGSTLSKKDKKFESRTIPLQGGEIFYLSTDGFQDQLGGSDNPKERKKYMKTKFIELLQNCCSLPITEQRKVIESNFQDWKGKNEQTDDVLIFGLKV